MARSDASRRPLGWNLTGPEMEYVIGLEGMASLVRTSLDGRQRGEPVAGPIVDILQDCLASIDMAKAELDAARDTVPEAYPCDTCADRTA